MRVLKSLIISIVMILMLQAGFSDAYGQKFKPQNRVDSLIVQQWNIPKIFKKWPLTGREALGVIQRTHPHDVDSLEAFGYRELGRRRWEKASAVFQIILMRETDHIGAHFGRGIAEREIGRNSFLIRRYTAWQSAEKHFKRILALDSTYKEVFFEYALLERYRQEYFNAIELAHRHLQVKLASDSTQRELLLFYDSMLNHVETHVAEKWLKFRDTKHDIYFLGELYRRTDQYARADSIFVRMLDDPGDIPLTAVHLSRVRLAVQENQPERAEEHYWQAVDAVETSLDKNLLLEDFFAIVNAKEYELLRKEIPKSLLKEALRVFWLKRNLLPSMPYNQRFIEHFKRYIEAEKRFYYDGFRHTMYKSDDVGVFPLPAWYYENRRLNDLGLIYVRFGDPDKRSTYVGGLSRDTPFVRGAVLPQKISNNLSWLYYKRNDSPQRIFHFCVPEDAPPSYWTLIPMFDSPEILEDMVLWDHRFYDIIHTDLDNPGYAMAAIQELEKERAEDVDVALKTDRPSSPKKDEILELYAVIDRFRLTDHQDILELSYAVFAEDVLEGVSKGDSVQLETGIKVFDGQADPCHSDRRFTSMSSNNTSGLYQGWYIDHFEMPIQRKSQNITFHTRMPSNQRFNGYRFVEPGIGSRRDRLSCSTLKLAFEITPNTEMGSRKRSDLTMIPNPTGRFERKSPVFVYYEIYNLTYDENIRTQYSVNFTLKESEGKGGVLKRITGMFSDGKPYQVSVQSEQSGKNGTVSDYISFDMSRAKKGSYHLLLEIVDRVTGETVERGVKLYLK